MKRLGIVGGLGPETGCQFCLNVNDLFRKKTNRQPDLVLENVPVPKEVENQLINGKNHPQMFHLLSKTIKRLNQSEADLIVIPCNTVHIFINQLRKISQKPILSIIEETVKECQKRNLKKVALLATTKTAKEKLYEKLLKQKNISLIKPNQKQQRQISQIIIKIIHNQTKKQDKQFFLSLIKKFKNQGAQAVILGCTDLPLLIKEKDSFLPVINTCQILEQSAVDHLIKNTNL